MKTNIFARIILATLLPVLLVLAIVIVTVHNVIYMDGVSNAREFVRLTARNISEQITAKLDKVSIVLSDISREMSEVMHEPDSARAADSFLNTLILSSRDIYSTWFAFEPGVILSGRYYKTLIRINGRLEEIQDKTDAMLSDPYVSPWYNVPLLSGYIYVEMSESFDYQIGEGVINVFTITYPIITSDGRTIGCVGLDMRYEDIFPAGSFTSGKEEKVMLVSGKGDILFSSGPNDIGKKLWDVLENETGAKSAVESNLDWQEEITSPVTGEKLLVCLYPVDVARAGQTLYLYRDTPAENIYNAFYSSMEMIITTGLLGMVLLMFSVFMTTRGIVRHIKRITANFNLIASGSAADLLIGERMPVQKARIIEIDILQSALVRMIVQLRRAHEMKLEAFEAEVEREKLIAASEAKSNFFAAMSHEIRTPMNAILGISEIMLFEGELSERQEKYIRDIKISSLALLNIINDILDISKLETEKMELHPEHYNFRALIENITSLASHLASDSNLQFMCRPDGELPLCLYGDGMRLRQVLLNLIGNAIKFTREGYVILRISIVAETIRFDVADTGIGIRSNEIKTIFESFKRVDTKRNRAVKGTGLGLSISKNLVELMGGTISVESVYGKGSVFSVILPLVLGDELKLKNPKSKKTARYSDTLRVLIVDDDVTNLRVSSGLFKAAYGINCDMAASGMEAISMVSKKDYDIIFMDHMMPELDGVDTTQRIRQLGGKFETVPIIALTANVMIGARKELIEGGMNDFIAKPLESEKLREILDLWVPDDKRISDSLTVVKTDGERVSAHSGSEFIRGEVGRELSAYGVDLFQGIKNIGFDEEMYKRSLIMLGGQLPETISKLRGFLAVDELDMREVRSCANGLKNSLLSLGASRLSSYAERVEKAALENDVNGCHGALTALINELVNFNDVLKRFLESDDSGQGGSYDKLLLRGSLGRLRAALENYDYNAVTDEVRVMLEIGCTGDTREHVLRIKGLVDDFEYAEAIETIGGYLAS